MKNPGLRINLLTVLLLIMITLISVLVLLIKREEKSTNLISAETDKYIVSEIKKCNEKKQTSSCYKHIASNFLDRYTLSQILKIFDKNEQSSDFIKSCHAISHYLGQEEYKRLKSVKQVILESKTDVCIAGTIHGAVEGFFMDKKIKDPQEDLLKVQTAIPEACGNINSYDNLIDYQTCVHGLGHALMNVAGNDLIEALKLCDYLQSETDQDHCYTGSFMQNSSDAFSREHPSKYFKANDPIYLCNILAKKYQKRCYTYSVLGLLQLNPQKSIDTCFQVPQEYRHSCFQTYGTDRVTVRQTEQEVKQECDLIKTDEYKIDCYSGASYDFVARYGLDSNTGHNFCYSLDVKFKQSCYKQLGNGAKRSTQNKKHVEKYCNRIYEEEYKNACRQS